MLDLPTSEEFIRMVLPESNQTTISFGKIDPNYTNGSPSVIYDVDISTGALSKPLMYLSSYTPAANDRVMIVKGVIIGSIL